VKRAAALALLVVLATSACGGSSSAKQPGDDPKDVAVHVLDQIVHNRYTEAWDGLYGADQKVAPRREYVDCESRSPVNATPISVNVVKVEDASVGLGDGTFVDSKAVSLRLGFTGGFKLVHVVHLVADDGAWHWILPSWRYRDYKADRCPTDAGSSPPPSSS
jgi:hypothetical protein